MSGVEWAPRLTGDSGLIIQRVTTAGERRRIHDFGLKISLRDPRYGLVNEKAFRDHYPNPEAYEFVVASTESGEVVGDLRLRIPYGLDRFDNLLPDHRGIVGLRCADIGIHIDRPKGGDSLQVLNDLWAYLVAYSRVSGFQGLYGQVRREFVEKWKQLGFKVATEPFLVAGWEGDWLGIWSDLSQLQSSSDERDFARDWKEATGQHLNRWFWRRVERLLQSESRWKPSDQWKAIGGERPPESNPATEK